MGSIGDLIVNTYIINIKNMKDEERRYLEQKASNGCALWLPIIALFICRFIVGMPKDTSKAGLIAYLVICIISDIWLFGSADGAKRMGMPKAAFLFWFELVIFLALTVNMVVLTIGAFQ